MKKISMYFSKGGLNNGNVWFTIDFHNDTFSQFLLFSVSFSCKTKLLTYNFKNKPFCYYKIIKIWIIAILQEKLVGYFQYLSNTSNAKFPKLHFLYLLSSRTSGFQELSSNKILLLWTEVRRLLSIISMVWSKCLIMELGN